MHCPIHIINEEWGQSSHWPFLAVGPTSLPLDHVTQGRPDVLKMETLLGKWKELYIFISVQNYSKSGSLISI